jgi:DNA polymerase-1
VDQKRIFIVDTMAMAFRSFHAFGTNQLRNSKGIPTSVVFSSLNFILKLIEDQKPDYLVFASDLKEKTFRHELYDAYKANRSVMPEEMLAQIPYLYEMIDILGAKMLKVPGLEADDLIGSMAVKYAEQGLKCFIVSGDKDFMQLINDNILLFSPQKGGDARIIDREGVSEKFGCTPEQVIDVLAIMGDSSDNVPGVKGVGEKGAQTLIEKYHTLEGIYANLSDIANKRQQTALETGREMAFLSRKLVTIKTDAEIPYDLDEFSCCLDEIMTSRSLLEFCERLELRAVAARIAANLAKKEGKAAKAVEVAVSADKEHFKNYQRITTTAQLDDLISELHAAEVFSFDTETTGLDIIEDRPIGISFSTRSGYGSYVPLLKQHTTMDIEHVLSSLRPVFGQTEKLKVGHNIKFDLQMLRNVGLEVAGPFYDTMIMAHLLDPSSRSNGLDACCLRYLNYTKIALDSLIDKSQPQAMLFANIDDLTRYACEDADFTLRLYYHLLPLLQVDELVEVAQKVEMPLIPILACMEQCGIYVDASILEKLSSHLDEAARGLEQKICEEAGEVFNVNSPKQLQYILFEKLKIHEQLGMKKLKKTKSGYSTDVSVLEQLASHTLVANILQYRTVTKLKNTYVDTLPQLICSRTDRIHTSFHQTGTATGRLSSSDPNLQNIPIRSELGREIRQAFRVKDPHTLIISADYSQVELRILAHFAHEKALIEAFKNGEDIHLATAARIFEVDQDQVTKDQRAAAKTINFGIIYGMGATRLARETGMSLANARSFIEKYFHTYPGIQTYIDEAIKSAKEKGYTRTITGRRRPLPEIHSSNRMEQAGAENIATNSPIQGSAADLIKIAMIELDQKIRQSGLNLRMLLQVHDELVFECPKNEIETACALIKQTMESAMSLEAPLVVEVGYGENWLDAH